MCHRGQARDSLRLIPISPVLPRCREALTAFHDLLATLVDCTDDQELAGVVAPATAQSYGRAYVGTGGRGILVGEPK